MAVIKISRRKAIAAFPAGALGTMANLSFTSVNLNNNNK